MSRASRAASTGRDCTHILTGLAEPDVIVFFKIDRLARSTVDFAEMEIMRLAEHRSVALAWATEPLDLTS